MAVTTFPSVDTNVGGATGANFTLGSTATSVSLQCIPKTGSHSIHKVQLQASLDGTNFIEIANVVNGTSAIISTDTYAYVYVRYSVVRAEGAASTCDIIIADK